MLHHLEVLVILLLLLKGWFIKTRNQKNNLELLPTEEVLHLKEQCVLWIIHSNTGYCFQEEFLEMV